MARTPKATAKPVKKAAVKKAAVKKAVAKKATAKPVAKKAAAPAKPKAIKVTVEPGKSITQGALLQMFADRIEMKRAQAKALLDAYYDIVSAHVLKGVKVKLGELGTLTIRHRKARIARNPQTGEPVKVKASKKLAFRQSATMRDAVK